VTRTLAGVRPIAVGFDPGMGRAGGAAVLLGRRPEEDQLLELVAWATEQSDRKRAVMASDDSFRRGCELASGVRALLLRLDSDDRRCVRVACAEAMSFPRNSTAAAKVALFWGVLAAERERCAWPLVQAGPQEIRRVFGLPKGLGRDAGKQAVHAALEVRYGQGAVRRAVDAALAAHPGATEKQRGELRRHPLDALAAVAAADGSEVVRMLRAAA
jgi:hypothetical protein